MQLEVWQDVSIVLVFFFRIRVIEKSNQRLALCESAPKHLKMETVTLIGDSISELPKFRKALS